MQIICSSCGALNRLEYKAHCRRCQAVLRRCTDCSNFSRKRHRCRLLNQRVTTKEAERPGLLSASANCRLYRHAGSLGPTAVG